MTKFLLRHGFAYDGKNAAGQRRSRWTRDFRAWVGRIDLGDASATAALDHYRECVREADAQGPRSMRRRSRFPKTQVEALVRCAQMPEGHRRGHGRLDRPRGGRFLAVRDGVRGSRPGRDRCPPRHSGGESQCRGSITKAGNEHLRRPLVEAAWHYKGASRSPKDLAQGSIGRRGDQAPRPTPA